jgi:hypothetical protein
VGLRICGLTIVRNEEDIVEASIRHNFGVLDALTVVDHGSDDGTSAIVEGLRAEGLPIDLVREEAIEYRQSDLMTAHARRILAGGADLCCPLDADEFLRAPSRADLERAAELAGATRYLAVPRYTCCPEFGPGDIVARLRRGRRLAVERHDRFKVIAGRALLEQPQATMGDGMLAVPAGGGPPPTHELVRAEVACVAHVPIRSAGQYTSKFSVGFLSRLLAGVPESDIGLRWKREYAAILSGAKPSVDDLEALVANYGARDADRADPAAIRWIDDPFLAEELALRHTPATPVNPLARILGFGERVAAEIERTTGGL